jgi:type II secretory pathway pseudopilin PulG
MPEPQCEDRCPTPRPAGFTIFEAMMVLLIMLTVVAALTPGVTRALSHARVNRAANVVAAQFYQAQSMAGRQHRPVTMLVSPGAKTITISDAVTPFTVLVTRSFGSTSEFNLLALSANPAKVYILPSGMASSVDTVFVGDASYSQKVYMSKAGQIRILRF